MTYELTEDINRSTYWCEKTSELSKKLFIPSRAPDAWANYDNYSKYAKFDNVASDIKIKKVTAKKCMIDSRKHRFYPNKEQLKQFNLFFKGYKHCYNKTVEVLSKLYLPLYEAADARYDEGLCNTCPEPHLKESFMCETHKNYRLYFKYEPVSDTKMRNEIVGKNEDLSEEDSWLANVPNECRSAGCFAAVTAYNTLKDLQNDGKIYRFYMKLKDDKSTGICVVNARAVKIINDEVFMFTDKIKEPLKMTKRTKKSLPHNVNCESMVICKNNKYYFVSVNDYSKAEDEENEALEKLVTQVTSEVTHEIYDELLAELTGEPKSGRIIKPARNTKLTIDLDPQELHRYFNEDMFNRDIIRIDESSNRTDDFTNNLNEEIKYVEAVKARNETPGLKPRERTKKADIETMERDIKNYTKHLNELKHRRTKAIKKSRNDGKILSQIKIIGLNARRDNIISLDPGLNTFQTGYDPSGKTYKFGNKKDLEFIGAHHTKHDKLDHLTTLVTGRTKYRIKKRILKINAKLSNRILDFHNKTAVFLATNYSNVIYPHLNVSQLMENCNVAVINRSYSSLSHYKFKVKLEQICSKYGSSLHQCKEYYTTKTCGNCGMLNDVDVKQIYRCSNQDCRYVCDRDSHGARNILLRQLTYAK